MEGTLGAVGGTWVPMSGLLMLVWGTLVIPFPLTTGLPLVGSTPCCTNSLSGLQETPLTLMPVEQPPPSPPEDSGQVMVPLGDSTITSK